MQRCKAFLSYLCRHVLAEPDAFQLLAVQQGRDVRDLGEAQVHVQQVGQIAKGRDIVHGGHEQLDIFELGQRADGLDVLEFAVVRQNEDLQLLQGPEPLDIDDVVVPEVQGHQVGAVLEHLGMFGSESVVVGGQLQRGKGHGVRADLPFVELHGPDHFGGRVPVPNGGQFLVGEGAEMHLQALELGEAAQGVGESGGVGDLGPAQVQLLREAVQGLAVQGDHAAEGQVGEGRAQSVALRLRQPGGQKIHLLKLGETGEVRPHVRGGHGLRKGQGRSGGVGGAEGLIEPADGEVRSQRQGLRHGSPLQGKAGQVQGCEVGKDGQDGFQLPSGQSLGDEVGHGIGRRTMIQVLECEGDGGELRRQGSPGLDPRGQVLFGHGPLQGHGFQPGQSPKSVSDSVGVGDLAVQDRIFRVRRKKLPVHRHRLRRRRGGGLRRGRGYRRRRSRWRRLQRRRVRWRRSRLSYRRLRHLSAGQQQAETDSECEDLFFHGKAPFSGKSKSTAFS